MSNICSDDLVKVERKVARDAYIAGSVVTVLDESNKDCEIIEFSCTTNIKDSSKVRKFNGIVKIYSDYCGIPSFFLEKNGGR